MSIALSKKGFIWSSVVSGLLFLFFLGSTVYPLFLAYKHQLSWQAGEATVIQSSYSRDYGRLARTKLWHLLFPQYDARIRYRYSVDGKDYVGYTHKVILISESRAKSFVGRYSGKEAEISFDPAKPSSSVLSGVADFEGFLIGLAFSVLLLLLNFSNLKIMKKNLWRRKL